MQNIEVVFYNKEDGTEPAKDFVNSLDKKMMAKMVRTIEMLQINGGALREPYSKLLNDGIFELRVKVGTDISRVLYFFFIGHKAILTNGFIKKSPKTPIAEIERAKAYRAEYMKRMEEHQ